MSNPGGSAATEAYDIYNPPQYRPDPDAARPEERRLSAWEDAWVKDPGMESHPARAHLDTGNQLWPCTCPWKLYISLSYLTNAAAVCLLVSLGTRLLQAVLGSGPYKLSFITFTSTMVLALVKCYESQACTRTA